MSDETDRQRWRQSRRQFRLFGSGTLEEVRDLVSRGFNLRAISQGGNTPLEIAIERNRLDILHYLIEAGANVNAMDFFGGTALHFAAQDGHVNPVIMLLGAGAHVETRNIGGFTALHLAATEGHIQIVRLLVHAGSDVNARCSLGMTPILRALMHAHCDIVHFLLESGADISLVDFRGTSALHIAADSGCPRAVKTVLAAGCDVHAKESNDNTALHRAVYGGSAGVVEMLLEAGADPEAKNTDGETPLLVSIYSTNHRILPAMLKNLSEASLIATLESSVNAGKVESAKSVILHIVLYFDHVMKQERFPPKSNLDVFWDECIKEIERLKAVKIRNTHYSCYNLLRSKNEEQLALYASFFDSTYQFIYRAGRFSCIYEDILLNNFKIGKIRQELTEKFLVIASHSDLMVLPSEIQLEIVNKMKTRDLKNFVKAAVIGFE